MTRKGGIPQTKLRGITDADFFQKNTTAEKGWTFNNDGTLVDYKRPIQNKDLAEKVSYEVSKETIVKEILGKGKSRYHKQKHSGSQSEFG